jgi:hypothetical protein
VFGDGAHVLAASLLDLLLVHSPLQQVHFFLLDLQLELVLYGFNLRIELVHQVIDAVFLSLLILGIHIHALVHFLLLLLQLSLLLPDLLSALSDPNSFIMQSLPLLIHR